MCVTHSLSPFLALFISMSVCLSVCLSLSLSLSLSLFFSSSPCLFLSVFWLYSNIIQNLLAWILCWIWFVAFLSHHRFGEPQVLQPTLTVMHTHFVFAPGSPDDFLFLFCLNFDLCFLIRLSVYLFRSWGWCNFPRLEQTHRCSEPWTPCTIKGAKSNLLCSVILFLEHSVYLFLCHFFWFFGLFVCLFLCLLDLLCIGACLSLI